MMDKERVPKFGEWVRCTYASESNPHRRGMFVRVIRRTGRVMNPGTWWELTNGKGDFWETTPDSAETLEPKGGDE